MSQFQSITGWGDDGFIFWKRQNHEVLRLRGGYAHCNKEGKKKKEKFHEIRWQDKDDAFPNKKMSCKGLLHGNSNLQLLFSCPELRCVHT